jgi:hypothetical protein
MEKAKRGSQAAIKPLPGQPLQTPSMQVNTFLTHFSHSLERVSLLWGQNIPNNRLLDRNTAQITWNDVC